MADMPSDGWTPDGNLVVRDRVVADVHLDSAGAWRMAFYYHDGMHLPFSTFRTEKAAKAYVDSCIGRR